MRNTNIKEQIGILGGTFNPIHNGHIALGTAAYKQFHLDKIWVMLSKTPPHKISTDILDASIRSDMVKLAIKEIPFMEYSDFELQREGYIYTADTLTLLAEKYPQKEFFFIIGGDSLCNFESWYHPEIILKKAVLLASGRNDLYGSILDEKIAYLKEKFPYGDIRKIILEDIPYSSSEIRESIKAGISMKNLLSESVAEYIHANKLYEM